MYKDDSCQIKYRMPNWICISDKNTYSKIIHCLFEIQIHLDILCFCLLIMAVLYREHNDYLLRFSLPYCHLVVNFPSFFPKFQYFQTRDSIKFDSLKFSTYHWCDPYFTSTQRITIEFLVNFHWQYGYLIVTLLPFASFLYFLGI